MPRTTRQQYFDAALAILGEQGPEALSPSMAALHEGMLAHWLAAFADSTMDELPGDAHGRLSALRELAVAANHETEVAIRAWAAWYEPAADAVRRVQYGRQTLLATT